GVYGTRRPEDQPDAELAAPVLRPRCLPSHLYDGAGGCTHDVEVVDQTGDDSEAEAARQDVEHVVAVHPEPGGVVGNELKRIHRIVTAGDLLTSRVSDDYDE